MIKVRLNGEPPVGHGIVSAEPESLTFIRCPKQTEQGKDGLAILMKIGPVTIIGTCTAKEFLDAAKAIQDATNA